MVSQSGCKSLNHVGYFFGRVVSVVSGGCPLEKWIHVSGPDIGFGWGKWQRPNSSWIMLEGKLPCQMVWFGRAKKKSLGSQSCLCLNFVWFCHCIVYIYIYTHVYIYIYIHIYIHIYIYTYLDTLDYKCIALHKLILNDTHGIAIGFLLFGSAKVDCLHDWDSLCHVEETPCHQAVRCRILTPESPKITEDLGPWVKSTPHGIPHSSMFVSRYFMYLSFPIPYSLTGAWEWGNGMGMGRWLDVHSYSHPFPTFSTSQYTAVFAPSRGDDQPVCAGIQHRGRSGRSWAAAWTSGEVRGGAQKTWDWLRFDMTGWCFRTFC